MVESVDFVRTQIGKSGVHTKYPSFLTKEECALFRSVIDKYELKVMELPNPYKSSYMGQLTGTFNVFNWLHLDELKELNLPERFAELDDFKDWNYLYMQCWANTLRKGEGIILHRHQGRDCRSREDVIEVYHREPPQFKSCNIFLGGKHNITWFEQLGDVEWDEGDLMVFHNHIIHEVEKNPYDDVRYSTAIDIYPIASEELYLRNKYVYERRSNN